MSESNAVLAERYRGNDEHAFTTLVRRYQSVVFGVCMRMLAHRQDAEDVTQETFSRLAKYLDRWDTERPLEPWLITIAGNRCRSFLARRRCWQPLTATVEPATEATRNAQAADWLGEEVRLALIQLPERQRDAFQLFYERSLSYAEIAQQLDCPLGTVKTLVHRARFGLIEQLRQREVIAGPPANRSPFDPSIGDEDSSPIRQSETIPARELG